MRPRPRPRQLQLPHPGHVLSLRLAISPCHRSSPSRSSAPPSRLPSPVPHCSLPFPSFRASLPCPPLPSSPVPPLLHSWLPLSFPHPLPLFSPGPSVLRALFSAPLPRPSLLLALPSPTVPRLAKGQISRGNQQRQTRCSDFIIVVNLPLQLLPQGSKPARLELRTDAEAEPAACLFRLKPLPQPLGLPPPHSRHFSAGGQAPGFFSSVS